MVADCPQPIKARGWCGTHYGRWLAGYPVPDATGGLRTRIAEPCTVDDCINSAYAQGMCHTHYKRDRPVSDAPQTHSVGRVAVACRAEGCEFEVKARGWCRKHYARWQREHDIQADPSGGVVPPVASGAVSTVQYATDRSDPTALTGTAVLCSVPGCEGLVSSKKYQWCRNHYQRWHKHGTLDLPAATPPPPRAPCAHEGCSRVATISTPWCPTHLRQVREPADTGESSAPSDTLAEPPAASTPDGSTVRVSPQRPPCTVEGCASPVKARGWCAKHYERWRSHGTTETTQVVEQVVEHASKPAFTPCSVGECELPARVRGWCTGHYQRWRKTGTTGGPLTRRRAPTDPCSVDECSAPVKAHGWCAKHYARWQRHGTTAPTT